MELIPMLALVALVKKCIDLIRYVKSGDVNGYTTMLAAWLAGVGAVALAAQTDFATALVFDGHDLAGLNIWSQVFVGLTVAATAGLASDTIKAVDSSQSAAVPPLVP